MSQPISVQDMRATSVSDVSKVASSLITTRRVIFTPSVEIKDELARTAINITCYDRDGNVVKRVTSTDDGDIEDPENPDGGSDGGGSGSPDSGSGSDGGGSGSDTGGSGTDTGGSGSDDEQLYE